MTGKRELLGTTGAGAEIYILRDLAPFQNNVYLLRDPGTNACLVIDGSEAQPILEATSDLKVQAVLITHGHRDHIAGLPDLEGKLQAPMGIGAADREMLPGPKADFVIQDGQTFKVGAHELRAIATPGHTPGSTCFLIDNILFSGDTLFPGGPGNTNKERNRYGDFDTIIQSIRTRLFTLPDATRVLPGHGLDTTIGAERPHLDDWIARGW